MAWVAIDKCGSEWIFEYCPFRKDDWEWGYEDYGYLELPKGSISKLIGRELTWNDEPVELVETKDKE